MAVEYENLKGVKPLNESKSRIEKDIITKIKLLEEDDDLNTNYLSEEKELIKEHFARIEEINEKIMEIYIKASLNTKEFGFDQQKYESIKFRQGITKITNENAPSSNSRRNLSREQTLLMLSKNASNLAGWNPRNLNLKTFLHNSKTV